MSPTPQRHRTVPVLILATTILSVSALPASAAPSYQLTDLGTGFIPYRISNAGQIVGQGPQAGYGPALLWQNGVVNNLGDGIAQDINANGQIVISIPFTGLGTPAPNIWENGVVTPLPVPTWAGDFRHYYAMNSSGHVVGQAADKAFLWDGTLHYLDVGGAVGSSSSSYAINDANQIVGRSGSDGFLWDAGVVTVLPDVAMDINDSSQVLLFISIWEGGVETPIGRLPLLPGSDENGCCGPTVRGQAINNLGQVVANQTDFYLIDEEHGYGAHYRSFLRDPSGSVWDLAELGGPLAELGGPSFIDWTFAWVMDINDAGQIVGFDQSTNRGFLLTPVPEPATLTLAGLGALIAILTARRIRIQEAALRILRHVLSCVRQAR